MDRHHPGGAPAGRDHEVGAVHDVGGAHEPFDRRTAQAGPRQVQWTRRHGPLSHGHAARDERHERLSPAPRHGEGAYVEVGPPGERFQGAGAEATHSGGGGEQGRSIDRDLETIACRETVALTTRPGIHRASLAQRRRGLG